ncbi:MAG: hypothetical protein BYD32DRAFT_181588 [Podila humilis]|nr:MAG: hypothetical protein BYD32DRAFT_181588 [Podila humilis]
MRRKEAASKTLRHQQGRRMVSNKKAHFTTHFKKAGSKATSAKMPSHLPASSILGNTEQLHQPDCVVPCRQEQTEQDLIQHSTVTFRIGGPAASTKKPTMGESVAMGNITPEVITAIGNKRPPLRKPTVHFVRHHVHMRVARIPRGIKANKEGKPNCSERELYFNSHRIMTEKVAVRFTAVPGLLFRRAVDGNSTLAALGPFPGFYADVSGSDHILYGCMPQLMELRHSDGEDRARDARNLNPSEISGVGCSFVLSKLRVDASKEFQSATKGRGIRTLTITKRKRAAVASSMTHTLCTKADFAQAEQITQSPMAATTTILHPSPLELPLATSSIPNQPAPHSQTSAKLSHVVSRDEAILFALESGLQSESGNPRTGELVHVLQRDVPDFLPVPYSVVSGTKRKASGQVRIQESPAVNPSLGLDPYWPDSWTEPMDNFSMLSSADLVSGFELSVQPWCQGPALVQGPTIQFPKRKALQNLPADGVLEPSRKRKVLEQQLQQWNANVTLSSPRHLTQDTIVFPVQNHNLRRNVGVRIASYGTTMITPKRMTSELERLSQWTIKEQVPSHGRRRAAPPRQAFGIPEMNQLDGPSTQDLATFLIGGQQEQLSSANSEIDESGPKPCVTSTMGVASELVPLDQSLEPLRPVIAKAEPAFQDSQPTSESRALLLTEPDLTIMTTKLLDTEAQSTISQPGGRNQQCRKEAYPYVDTQSEVGKASVAGAEPAPGRPPNLSKKLLSPLASDPHPSQDPGVSVLNRGSLHTKGSNRLSEVEQLQIWTIKNSEPSFVRSRRTLTLQE